MTISPSFLYFVIPLGLWSHFGLSPLAQLRGQWPGIRRRIALLYLPAAVFDLVALGLEMRPGRSWGLLPYFAGLGLILWGYAGLERQARSGVEKPQPTALEPIMDHRAGPNVA